MAIKVNNINVIDDSRQLNVTGVSTLGTVEISSGIVTATSGVVTYYGDYYGAYYGDGSNLTGVITAIDSIDTTGIITCYAVYAEQFVGTGDNLIFSPTITSFSPTDGATNVAVDTNIVLTFDQPIYAGVGSVFLRNSSSTGTVIEAIGIGSTTQIAINNQTLTINPSSNLPYATDVYVVMPQGVIKNSVGGNNELLDTYNFTTVAPPLGSAYEGGYLICEASNVRWVVAPSASQVDRNWYAINDAVTRAEDVSGCSGWFVPTCGQLINPANSRKNYWDSYANDFYWSSTEINSTRAWTMNFQYNIMTNGGKSGDTNFVRALRCVSY